jgi:hypothetical protein
VFIRLKNLFWVCNTACTEAFCQLPLVPVFVRLEQLNRRDCVVDLRTPAIVKKRWRY